MKLSEVGTSCFPESVKEFIRNEYRKKTVGDRNTDSTADMEQPIVCKQMEAEEHQRFNNPVRIHILTFRKRETDCLRSISEKAVIDALVKTKVLRNDSRKEIPEDPVIEVIISEEEKTIITIEEI
jgi:Holliday junction resolvase RusA-like endonuclease